MTPERKAELRAPTPANARPLEVRELLDENDALDRRLIGSDENDKISRDFLAVADKRAEAAERHVADLKEALRPFADVVSWLDRLQAEDRTVRLDHWLHASGSGSSGNYELGEGPFREADRVLRATRDCLAAIEAKAKATETMEHN